MFTTGTQFDLTEEGTQALEALREADLYVLDPKSKLEYTILTILDMEGLMDYGRILAATPRSADQSDVSDVLRHMARKHWITVEE